MTVNIIKQWIEKELFRKIPTDIFVIDRNYTIVTANPSFEDRFGEWKNKKCYKILNVKNKKCKDCTAEQVFLDGRPRKYDRIHFDKNGRKTYNLVDLLPVTNDAGEIIYTIEMLYDTSRSKRIQEEYKILFDRVPCFITVLDSDLRILRANEQVLKEFGDVHGKFCYEIYGKNKTSCDSCPILQSMEDGKIHTAERKAMTPSGKKIFFLSTAAPLHTGQINGDQFIEISTDISHQKYIEKELKKNIEYSQHIIKNSSFGLVLLDTNKTIVEANPAALSILKRPREEVISRKCNSFFCPAVKECPILDKGKEMDRAERIAILPDGKRIPILKSAVPINIQGINYLLETFIDISQMKEAEQKLKLSEKKFRSLVQSSRDAIVAFDEKGIILMVNPAAEKLFGYSGNELINHPLNILMPEKLHKRFLRFLEDYTQKSTLHEYFSGSFEMRLTKKTGELFTSEISLSESKYSQDKRMLFATIRDITDRKNAERELKQSYKALKENENFTQSLIENSAIPTFVIDKRHKTIYWNKAMEQLTGYKSEEIINTRNHWRPFYSSKRDTLADLVLDGTTEKINEYYENAFPSNINEGAFHGEGWYKNVNGKDRYIMFDASPIINEKGQKIAVIETIKDITERKIAEEKLQEAYQLLQETQEEVIRAERLAAVGQTVAGLAHGIKNILGGLKGGMYVLKTGAQKGDPSLVERSLSMLDGNINRITILSKQLLDFARGTKMNFQITDPVKIVREIVELFKDAASQHGIELKAEINQGIEKLVLDPEGIHTCLANLISNSIDACETSEKPDCTVVVRVKYIDETLIYEVEDNGCGMDYETKQKVFTTFFTTKGSGGSGIGLLITKRIIQEHGGSLEVQSERGEGSIFRIVLPKKRLPAPTTNT